MSEVEATLTVGAPEELADRYYPNGKLGGLAVDGERPGLLGVRVRLKVAVRRPAREFSILGQLAWARHKAPRQPAAFGIDFLPTDDATRVRLLAFARHQVDANAIRAAQRVQVELPVRIIHLGKSRREFLADLSVTGAFVRTWNPIAQGELIELLVRPPRSIGSISVKGYVVWSRTTGPHLGMGVEFVDDPATHVKLAKMLAKLTAG